MFIIFKKKNLEIDLILIFFLCVAWIFLPFFQSFVSFPSLTSGWMAAAPTALSANFLFLSSAVELQCTRAFCLSTCFCFQKRRRRIFRRQKQPWCLIHLCLSYFVETPPPPNMSSPSLSSSSSLLPCRLDSKPFRIIRLYKSKNEDDEVRCLPSYHSRGVNSQSAKAHRSYHCLIIQTQYIYAFSTKESRSLAW